LETVTNGGEESEEITEHIETKEDELEKGRNDLTYRYTEGELKSAE